MEEDRNIKSYQTNDKKLNAFEKSCQFASLLHNREGFEPCHIYNLCFYQSS